MKRKCSTITKADVEADEPLCIVIELWPHNDPLLILRPSEGARYFWNAANDQKEGPVLGIWVPMIRFIVVEELVERLKEHRETFLSLCQFAMRMARGLRLVQTLDWRYFARHRDALLFYCSRYVHTVHQHQAAVCQYTNRLYVDLTNALRESRFAAPLMTVLRQYNLSQRDNPTIYITKRFDQIKTLRKEPDARQLPYHCFYNDPVYGARVRQTPAMLQAVRRALHNAPSTESQPQPLHLNSLPLEKHGFEPIASSSANQEHPKSRPKPKSKPKPKPKNQSNIINDVEHDSIIASAAAVAANAAAAVVTATATNKKQCTRLES